MRFAALGFFLSSLSSIASASPLPPSLTPCVDSTVDPVSTSGFASDCANDCTLGNGGNCTFREAILQANTGSNSVISFAIASGAQNIALTSLLPTISQPVTIDGFSQSNDGAPLITITGIGSGAILTVNASNSVIQGLAFDQFGTAIDLKADGCVVAGNYIGVDAATGTIAVNHSISSATGINVESNDNQILGANLIAASANGSGVVISGDGNTVQGNIIGLDATGGMPLQFPASTSVNGNSYGVHVLGGAGGMVSNQILQNTIATSSVFEINDAGTTTQIANNALGLSSVYTVAPGLDFDGQGITETGVRSVINSNFIGSHSAGDAIQLSASGDVTVSGNSIGLDTNNASAGNAVGIHFVNSTGVMTVSNNFIGNSTNYGVDINNSNNISLIDNTIGVASDNASAAPNLSGGVLVESGTNISIGDNLNDGDGNFIADNGGDGVNIIGGDVLVAENNIGFDPSGNFAGNGHNGVTAASSAGAVTIQDNFIANNTNHGIAVTAGSPSILGNWIGISQDGSTSAANGGDGVNVNVNTSTAVTIGDVSLADIGNPDLNVISGNTGNGVNIVSAQSALLVSNVIGTDPTLSVGLANGLAGVLAQVADVVVGNEASGANVIAYNGSAGVATTGSVNAVVLGNSIFNNGALGIDLGQNGQDTANTPAANNYPVLTAATGAGASLTVTGTLTTSLEITNYKIELFASPTCDPSGYGQGATFLGSQNVLTDITSSAAISANLSIDAPDGYAITATSTELDGGSAALRTSEFSQCVTLVKNGTFGWSATTSSVDESAGMVTLTITRTDGSHGPASVTVTTADASASAGLDYTAVNGTVVNFADGDTSKNVSISLLSDPHPGSSVDFTVALSDATGGALDPNTANTTATVTITDNSGSTGGSSGGSTGIVSGSTTGGSTTGGSTTGGSATGGSSGSVVTPPAGTSSSGGSTGSATGVVTVPPATNNKKSGCNATPAAGEWMLVLVAFAGATRRRRSMK